VLGQTYDDLELIVIDDGSTDETSACVRRFRDPRIRLLTHPENRGVCESRNSGLDIARGKWIAPIDADDRWTKDRLERLLSVAEEHPGSFVGNNLLICFSRNDELVPWKTLYEVRGIDPGPLYFPDPRAFIDFELSVLPIFPLDTIRSRRIRFRQQFWGHDWLVFLLELYRAGLKYVIIDEPLYLYRGRVGLGSTNSQAVMTQIKACRFLRVQRWFDQEVQSSLSNAEKTARHRLFTVALQERKMKKAMGIAIQFPTSVFYLFKRLPARMMLRKEHNRLLDKHTCEAGFPVDKEVPSTEGKGSADGKPRVLYPSGTGAVIIILNWNGANDIINCLSSIKRHCFGAFPIIVVDNGSSDDSIIRIIDWAGCQDWTPGPWAQTVIRGHEAKTCVLAGPPRLSLISLPKNLGGSEGRNIGIEWAFGHERFDGLFFLDNDAELRWDSIGACIHTARAEHSPLVGAVVRNFDGSLQFSGLRFLGNIFYLDILSQQILYPDTHNVWDVDEVSSCGMFVGRDLLHELKDRQGHYFDPGYFHWSEDQEMCLRAKRSGHRVVMTKKAVVYHKISRGGAGLAAAYYYSSRNRIFLATTFLPAGWRVLFHAYYPVYRIFRAVWNLLSGRPRVFSSMLEGLRDGYTGKRGIWRKQAG